MCDRCRDIRSLVETKVNEVVQHFEALGDTKEHHIAQILRDDPMANAVELRKAFTSIGPNFHVAMQTARVAVQLVLEAHGYDTIQTQVALTELVMRIVGERHQLLHMETPSGTSPTQKTKGPTVN